jgi:mRNA interferase MazF
MVEAPKRGEVYWVAMEPVVGSEMGKMRPGVIVQNDVGNRFSPITIVVPVTSARKGDPKPFQAQLPDDALPRPSVAVCNHVRSVDKGRLRPGVLARLDDATMARIDGALRVALGLY